MNKHAFGFLDVATHTPDKMCLFDPHKRYKLHCERDYQTLHKRVAHRLVTISRKFLQVFIVLPATACSANSSHNVVNSSISIIPSSPAMSLNDLPWHPTQIPSGFHRVTSNSLL